MFKKLCNSAALLSLLVAVPAMADESIMSKYKVSFGGYVKLDYAHNSNASGPTTSPAGATQGGFKEESIFTAKQSRMWFKVAGPTFMGAKTNALIEADFYGANSLANEFGNMRMRHAYGSLDWDNTQVLFGQWWDVFGPAAADTIDFRQGGDSGAANAPRVPQIRLTQKLNFNADNSLKFILAVQNPTQDTPVAASNAQAVAGTAGTTYGTAPNAAGQIMFTSKALGTSPGFMGMGLNPLQVGFFGQVGNEKVVGSPTSVDTFGYGVYAFVPLVKSTDGKSRAMTLSLEGQAYQAAGMNVSGATSISLVGPATARQAAKGYGLYGQLKFYPTQDLGLTAGYTRRGAINYADYRAVSATTTQKYNSIAYINATYDLNAAVRLATEFEHHATQYMGVKAASADNIASDYGKNNVIRFAAYYFF